MQVLVLGIGDAFTRRHFSSSALIRAPRGHVLIDCPDLVHRVVHEAASAAGWVVDATAIDDVIVTHLHGDHCNGLESFGFARRLQRLEDPHASRPRLHVSRPVAERLWERLAPAMEAPMGTARPSTLGDYFEVHVMSPERPAAIAGLSVGCRFTGHPVPTVGLLVADGPAVLGWSGDTPYEAAHLDWLDRAEVIVHEANVGSAHTSIDDLNALPDELRRRMRLIHLPDDFDPAGTDIAPLRQGEVLRLGDSDQVH